MSKFDLSPRGVSFWLLLILISGLIISGQVLWKKNQCESYGAHYDKSVKLEYSFFYGVVCRESNGEGWNTVPTQSLYLGNES